MGYGGEYDAFLNASQIHKMPLPPSPYPSTSNSSGMQVLPNATKPWKAVPQGTLLHALSQYLSPNRVLLTFDENDIVFNLVRTLKISRKCIVYIEASPKRSATFGEYQREDFPLLRQLMLHLPPTTRWGWQRLSTENLVGRFASVPRFLITNAFHSEKARRVYNPNVVPLDAFLIQGGNSNADIIAEHGDRDNVLKRRDVEPPPTEGVCVCVCM
jgi:hypothetical protein